MAIGDAVPEIVAARMIRRLGETLVFAARTNPEYTAELRDGDKVHMVQQGDVTVGDYTPGTAFTPQTGAPGSKITLELNKKKYYAVYIDDVHARQARPNILQSAVNVGATKLAEQIDADVKTAMHAAADAAGHSLSFGATGANNGIDLSDATAGAINAVDAGILKNGWVAAQREMDDANVPQPGRFAIIGPVMRSALSLLFSAGEVSDAVLDTSLRNGFVGSLFGFNIYMTSNPKNTAASESLIWGSDYGLATVVQIDQSEQLRDPGRFGDIVRGLAVYGSKAIEPESLYEATLHYEGASAFS